MPCITGPTGNKIASDIECDGLDDIRPDGTVESRSSSGSVTQQLVCHGRVTAVRTPHGDAVPGIRAPGFVFTSEELDALSPDLLTGIDAHIPHLVEPERFLDRVKAFVR